MKHNNDDKVHDGAHDDEEGANLKTRCCVVVETNGEGACIACLAPRGGGGGGAGFGRGAADTLAKAGRGRSCSTHDEGMVGGGGEEGKG